MNYIRCMFLLAFANSILIASAQQKDMRAKLDIEQKGWHNLFVTPKEKLFLLSSLGEIYYSEGIDSYWHYHQSHIGLRNQKYDFPQHLQRGTSFNNDIAIITGYISYDESGNANNGLYRTTDGGEHWTCEKFDGDDWIYDVFALPSGKAWMGGSSGKIYYTSDFGRTWIKLNTPYNNSSRMGSIFMADSSTGISTASGNSIYTTSDNWKSFQKVATPLDQKKYAPPSRRYSQDEARNVIFWGPHIAVNQGGHTFYTDRKKIDWHKLPLEIGNYLLDAAGQSLYAVTIDSKIVKFTSPTKYYFLSKKQFSGHAASTASINGNFYVLNDHDEVYKINETEFKKLEPYTLDNKIKDVQIVRKFSNKLWGASGHHLYLADSGTEKEWYRENVLDYYISEIFPVTDEEAVLVDKQNHNYLYSTRTHTCTPYVPQTPLATFLDYPVKQFVMISDYHGCFGDGKKDTIVYTHRNDSLLTVSKAIVRHALLNATAFDKKIKANELTTLLSSIDKNPSYISSIAEYNINDTDIENYTNNIRRFQCDSNAIEKIGREPYSESRCHFLLQVPRKLDTLTTASISKILDYDNGVRMTIWREFTIFLVNTHNDTIRIEGSTNTWNLPWTVYYKSNRFRYANVAFSRFVNDHIPDQFVLKDLFDNRTFIWRIASFLYDKR